MQLATLINSPVDTVIFENRQFYIKRDDLLDKTNLHSAFCGNKARKFYYCLHAFLNGELGHINKLISYGSPQANSLYSFAALANITGWQLDFYVDHINDFMKQQPKGNYRAALDLGANIIELRQLLELPKQHRLDDNSFQQYIEQQLIEQPTAIFVPEGGRCRQAKQGVAILATEVLSWAQQQKLTELKVVLPSGTGTTALFLNQQLQQQQQCNIQVLTCACVGGDSYLQKQFFELAADESIHPTILSAAKKYHFGKLYAEFYQIWQALQQQTAIEFDLLYDPLGWITLMDYLEQQNISDEVPVLYIHQGGLLGNETMLPRYQRKFRGKKCV